MSNLSRSNAMHEKLAKENYKKLARASSYSDYEKYQVRQGYHKEVALCQSHIGRVLTKSERKKAFASMQKHSGFVDIRGLFTK